MVFILKKLLHQDSEDIQNKELEKQRELLRLNRD